MSPIQFNPRMKERDWGGWRNARVSVVLFVILFCTACGFQLREDMDLPPEMARTRMVIDDEYSLLARLDPNHPAIKGPERYDEISENEDSTNH